MAPSVVNRRSVVGVAIVAIATALSYVAAPELPATVTTNWNAAGIPNGSSSRMAVLVGGPAMVMGIVALFEVIPRIDPLSENIASFRGAYDALALGVAGFITYVYGIVLAWNLGYDVSINRAIVPAIAVLYLGIGFLIERSERNWFVGIRTPWTLSSDTVWRRTHDLGGTLFKLAGLIALGALVVPSLFVYFVAVPAGVVALVTTVYSFLVYRRVGEDEEEAAEDAPADD